MATHSRLIRHIEGILDQARDLGADHDDIMEALHQSEREADELRQEVAHKSTVIAELRETLIRSGTIIDELREGMIERDRKIYDLMVTQESAC